jgi:alginate O-acetyltransferase complex protein AlgI
MVFSELLFIYAFLPLLMLFYFAGKSAGWRRGVLLVFSLVFYACGEPIYILLMLGSALMNYLFGLLVGQDRPEKQRKQSAAFVPEAGQ